MPRGKHIEYRRIVLKLLLVVGLIAMLLMTAILYRQHVLEQSIRAGEAFRDAVKRAVGIR